MADFLSPLVARFAPGIFRRPKQGTERQARPIVFADLAGMLPSDEYIRHKLEEALSALSRGVYWDRGSILNVLL